MNKNMVIFILVVLIFIGGIWGSLADRKRIVLEKKLTETVEQMQKLTDQSSKQRDQVLGKTAGLQETLAEKETQLSKARKELVSLRKEIKAMESQLSECNATIQKMGHENEMLSGKLRNALDQGPVDKIAGKAKTSGEDNNTREAVKKGEVDKARKGEINVLNEKLQIAELTIERLQQKLDGANAQMMGLEKLLEEKNSAMEETSQDMDRLKINMDVLLSKIADQRDEMQEIQEENRDLVKELAVKNEELADLQEEVMRQPVKE